MNWYLDVFKKYAVFEGRATRQEFWMFVLINFIVSIAVGIIGSAIGLKVLVALYSVAILLPSLALGIRRLHDTGKSGWWSLLALIPFIGWLVLIIFFVMDSQPDTNQYGPSPKSTISAPVTQDPVVPVVEKQQEEVIINDIPTKEEVSSEEKI